jgi:succinate dehydrogenase / fumarate reductase membrane anchor subunit
MAGASKKLLLQYITAILLIFLLTWHLVIRVPALRGVSTFAETLANERIYHEITAYGALLLLFAYTVLLHAFNGLRNILLEWSNGKYNAAITGTIVILFIVFAGLATYTVVGITPPPTGG